MQGKDRTMRNYFHLPNRKTLKGKSATIICMVLIIVALYWASYVLFLKTVDVDVTQDASIVYNGETGSANVKVKNDMKAYNQRMQDFMDSITYSVTPESALSNGETITIKASYDAELARRYNIHPIHATRHVVVANLPVRFKQASDIPNQFLNQITTQGKDYIKSHINGILTDDFTTFAVNTKPTLKRYQLIYRSFLNAKNDFNKDKIIDVYKIIASGEETTADNSTVKKDETIYYTVTFNEINTSLTILDENIYGEKLILGNGHFDLSNKNDFERYMGAKYGKLYDVTYMDITQQ